MNDVAEFIGKCKIYACSEGKRMPANENNLMISIKGGILAVEYAGIPIESVMTEWDISFEKGSRFFCDSWERGYGDFELSEKPKAVMPWYFMCVSGKKVRCFGVKTQPNALCYWKYGDGKITLTADIRNGTEPLLIRGRRLELCKVVTAEYEDSFFEASKKFCALMCKKPLLPGRPVFGGNDWYCNYGDNSYEKIIEHTKRIVSCSKGLEYKPYMVIDDGWELCHHQSENDGEYFNGGPWTANGNFGDMKKLAEDISSLGAVPGLWFRPLWTAEKLPDNYYLKHKGIKYTLDPSAPGVLELVKNEIKRFKEQGYKLIKHDFSSWDIFGKWGFQMEADMYKGECVFHDKTKTTAEIIKNFYKAIREAAGDSVLIMGCNTLSHLAAGIFEIQRTGDDTSGNDWNRTKTMGVNTLAFRMCQHGTFYAADADCVGITENIVWDKNRMWLDVLSKSGTPLFVSIAENMFTEEIKKDIKEAFEKCVKVKSVSEPLDLEKSKTPKRWKSVFGTDKYDWN